MKLLNCYECSRGFQNRKDDYTDCGFCTRLQQEQRESQLQLHAEHGQHHQQPQQENPYQQQHHTAKRMQL